MRDLEELFNETAHEPGPPSALTAETLYAAGRRRRLRTTGLRAVGSAIAIALVITAGGALWKTTSQSEPTNGFADVAGKPRLISASAADLNHIYAVVGDCPTTTESPLARLLPGAPGQPVSTPSDEACKYRLIASDNGGRTWKIRSDRFAGTEVTARTPNILSRIGLPIPPAAAVDPQKFARVSVDGGRTWKEVTEQATPVAAVPTRGWIETRCDIGGPCTVLAVDPDRAQSAPLATQPVIAAEMVREVPDKAGIWVSGKDPATNRAAVAVSHDRGRTWSAHTFNDAHAPGASSAMALPTTVDGRTVYAVVQTFGPESSMCQALVYRSTNGGETWERLDPNRTVPWAYGGGESYITRNGTHIVTVKDNWVPHFWVSRDGGARYEKTGEVTGLGELHWRVETLNGGGYFARNGHAIYRSTDGLRFTEIPLK